MQNDIDDEIEKLQLKKVELTSEMNVTTDFDDKEKIEDEINRIQDQIKMLEKFRKK